MRERAETYPHLPLKRQKGNLEVNRRSIIIFFFFTFKEEETLYLTIDRRSMLSKKQVASVSLLLHFNNAFEAYVMREF